MDKESLINKTAFIFMRTKAVCLLCKCLIKDFRNASLYTKRKGIIQRVVFFRGYYVVIFFFLHLPI